MIADIRTGFITLFGEFLSRSFAARMQNAACRAMGENLLCFYTGVENGHPGEAVRGLRYLPFKGFSVAKPNKAKALEYPDEPEPLCKKMGASNTVAIRDGKLIGYNTDGLGIRRSFREETGMKSADHTFFLKDAGRAICSILA